MNLQKLAAAIALATLGFAAQAQTVNQSFNSLSNGSYGGANVVTTIGLSGGPLTSLTWTEGGQVQVANTGADDFLSFNNSDGLTLTFALSQASNLNLSFFLTGNQAASTAQFSVTGLNGLNVSSLLVGDTNGNTQGLANPGAGSGVQTQFNFFAPTAGNYTFTLANVAGNNGGNNENNGNRSIGLDDLSLTVTSAVPEPESYALMLSGLAALGFMSKRRRAK